MARMARVVVPGQAHHVIQRGNRRQNVFFNAEDKDRYLVILKDQLNRFNVKLWAYCLMDNHVHLVLVPECFDGLSKAVGNAHCKYTREINKRQKWGGYLWQGRFKSFVVHDSYLYHLIRYVENNPVRAKIVNKPERYRWSSAQAHVQNRTDELLSECWLAKQIKDWKEYLREPDDVERLKAIREHSSSERPLGSGEFLDFLEKKYCVTVRRRKPGSKVNN